MSDDCPLCGAKNYDQFWAPVVTDEMVYRALKAVHPNPDPAAWSGIDIARATESMRAALKAALGAQEASGDDAKH